MGLHGLDRLPEVITTFGAGEPDLVSCAFANSDSVLAPLPCHRSSEASKSGLQRSGLRVTSGFGAPDLASWVLANSKTVPEPPSATHRSPEASKVGPPRSV